METRLTDAVPSRESTKRGRSPATIASPGWPRAMGVVVDFWIGKGGLLHARGTVIMRVREVSPCTWSNTTND